MVTVPLLAVATLGLGLRVGAGDAVRAAIVFGAPTGRPAPDGKVRLAWQLLTVVDDRGVRETAAMAGLTVTARTADGREATWTGATNEDGIAEIALAFAALEPGAPVDLVVRAAGEPEPLAAGRVRWEDGPHGESATGNVVPIVRPTKRSGAVGLDLFVPGERLVTGFDTRAWVRLSVPDGVSGNRVGLELEPEPGLDLASPRAALCPARAGEEGPQTRWAPVPMRAMGHVTGIGVKAVLDGATVGEWFGALPVAAGAFQPALPAVVPASTPSDLRLVAPNPRTVVYAEVDDDRGRVAAEALAVTTPGPGPGASVPSATFRVPALANGLHWLVVSGEPRGAETRSGAAMAWPFLVGSAPGVDPSSECSVGPWLLAHPAPRFPRWTALDGLPLRHTHNRRRHAAGLAIALVALVAAGALEALLLTAVAREARARMDAITADADEPGTQAREGEAGAAATAGGMPVGSVAVAVLLAVIGFALLGALVVAKG
jgi:hypothetical protein